ncbi:discoidin domain-containing protein [Dyella silvatica]|uniref:discoidin domain-containing protein n=1 Tax=Dyella silvatica TaxID=2992128 RepID=UPI00224CB23B|nr:discoidin domain-containing protein [Dyella silvatica]
MRLPRWNHAPRACASRRAWLTCCTCLLAIGATTFGVDRAAGAHDGQQVDYALHQPTTGSVICKPGEEAEKAVNGLWASKTQDKFCSKQRPAWLQIDLSSEREVHGFRIRHAGAGGEPVTMNTRAFHISTSDDGNTWTTVVSVQNNHDSVSTHPIKPIRAQYVRLVVTQPTQAEDDPATRIYEVEVW